MFRLLRNVRVWITLVVVAGLLAVALWPKTFPVDVAVLGRGPLMVTVDEEGRTRVRDRFVVGAPVAGRVLRIELEPGDVVHAGDVVARLQPETPALLDVRSRAEAEAALTSARAAAGRAAADEQRVRAALVQAERELARAKALVAESLGTTQQLEARDAEVRTLQEQVNAAVFAARAAAADVDRAQARLAPARVERGGGVVPVTAPVDGVVLKRVRESETVVPAGDPLLEIGDPAQLEIVVDLLSLDAVRVKPGARVLVEQWGGDRALDATVTRIEPSGFTKISALGVEEQRVNVVLAFTDASGAWKALGDGYRVQARIVTWEAADVVKVPTGALVRVGSEWAVYRVQDGRAVRATVTLGHQNGQEAEVTGGLEPGAVVILHPGDAIVDGVKVVRR
ncbi:MAG: HlyD family efflux transporter periplasmic adaptor subunit [Vicinamibacterales bacterium]